MKDKFAAQSLSNKPLKDFSLAETAEELQIMVAIRKGKADVKAGRVKSHAQVEKFFEAWISK